MKREERAAVADQLVRSLYSGFRTEDLQEMVAIGRDPQTYPIEGDPEITVDFLGALQREIERRTAEAGR
jgi:hypothetical protein